ncbi:hypothetical protein PSS2_gp130 [Cyanophage PSS2]|nr:hypothetical protein PSS2_gp130 [Cyanophage PSS2]ACT65692.1 hypothetical protein [Cyanophage PSS2]
MDFFALILALSVFKSGPITINTEIVDISFTKYPLKHKVTLEVATW